MILIRMDLAGGKFDKYPIQRITKLALKQDSPILKQWQHDDRARRFDVLTGGWLAVRQRYRVALYFKKIAIVGQRAIDAGFFQMLIHTNTPDSTVLFTQITMDKTRKGKHQEHTTGDRVKFP